MDRTVLAAILGGIILALGVFGWQRDASWDDSRRTGMPAELEVLLDSRYAGLPTEPNGFAPFGWLYVVEPPPSWNPQGASVLYPICPKPEWFPYDRFLGPPVPVAAVGIDPTGYMFSTEEGIRVHRDGWVVTDDGRAFRAEAKIGDMGFPELPESEGGAHVL
jgi:hypothetical protein